jgi:hypothetical protein
MGAVTKRLTKGSPLTTAEADANFDNHWNSIKLTADQTNATTTPATITDGTNTFSWTPPANTDYEIEAWILVVGGAATTNLPSISAAIPAGGQWASASIQQTISATSKVHVGAFGSTGAITATVPAGSGYSLTFPLFSQVIIKGKSGAAPSAITIRCAAESAAANACIVKAGSVMRYRTVI